MSVLGVASSKISFVLDPNLKTVFEFVICLIFKASSSIDIFLDVAMFMSKKFLLTSYLTSESKIFRADITSSI